MSRADKYRPYNRRNKKSAPKESKSVEQFAEENIKKLLALSKSTTDEAIAGKVIVILTNILFI